MTILTPKGYSPARQPRSEEPQPPAPPAEAPPPAPEQSPDGAQQPQIRLTFPPQVVGINCPNCGTPYPAQVFSVVDVGQDPVLKSLLLSGQLNVALCPRCGAGGPLTTPLLYHDPAHSFLGVYVPQQIPVNEQQKVIGDLSRRLMDGLPQEARRGYMLTPTQFLSFQSLLEAVLEHEGVTREMMDKQRRQIQLVEQAIMALMDPEGLRQLVRARDADMDDEFFSLLSMLIDSTGSSGDAESVRELMELRERLIELTTWGQGVQRQRAAVAQLRPDTTPAELVNLVVAADEERVVDALVMAGRPLVNYAFFQELTGRVEAAEQRGDAATAARLTGLREHILQFSQRLDEAQRAAVQEYTTVLGEILAANDIQQAIAERAAYIDQNFLSVLSANLQEAEKRGAGAAMQRLQEVWDVAVDMINQGAPPEARLINELLLAEYPGETRKLLAENRALVTAEFIEALSELAERLEAEDEAEMATRLRQIRSQAQLMR
ncbi:MAG: CpXC domain-containing protein [Anaerolinea sp.]|nr:CpXC domain-containing protein [Anaerolinea sp.]